MNKKTLVSISLVLIGVIAGLLWSSAFTESKQESEATKPSLATKTKEVPPKESVSTQAKSEAVSEPINEVITEEYTQESTDSSGTIEQAQPVPNNQIQKEGSDQIITTRHYIITQPVQTITQPQVIITSPAQTFNTTIGGYEVPVGSLKSMDCGPINPHWTMGENGLWQNPPVDPPSTRGRAYSSLQ